MTNNHSNHHITTSPRPSGVTSTHRRLFPISGLAISAVLAAGAFTAAAADAGPGPSVVAVLQAALDDVVAAGAPGAVVLVRDGDETVRLSSGFGNLEPSTPMRIEDRARIGGVTKSFTATVVLQLVGEYTVALDDTVERWLPGVIPGGDDITIRQLLNHTSGLFNYSSDESVLAPYMQGNLTQSFDPRDGVQVAADHDRLFPPGTSFSYSNTNYLLLAMIVEAATGNPFESELTARIVEPLGLDDTSYTMSSELAGSYTHGYIMQGAEPPIDVTAWNPALFGASGAILTNADDLARFYDALIGGDLLPAGLLAEMMTIDSVATGGLPDAGILGGGWGLGLLREEYPCGVAWGHDAENPGYMTAAWASADAQRQVVVIVNSNFDHDEPVSEAMRTLLAVGYCD